MSAGGERRDFTWSWSAGGAYIASIVTTADMGTTAQVQKRVTQTVNDWGNVTQAQTFDYGNLTTPVRTYAMTYLEGANYTSRYIRNRPLSASVNGTVVVTHSYDTESPIDRGGLTYHDSSYGTSYIYRGNATVTAGPPTGQVTTLYEITGAPSRSYDALWRGVSTTPSASTNYSLPGTLTVEGNTSLTTTIGYNSAFQVTSVSGANSNDTATTEYDTAGRPSVSTTADGYDPVPANRHSTTYAYTATTQTATLGTRWKRTTIDGFGRVSKVEAGHETTTESVVETEYTPCGCSPLGKVKRVSQPHAPGAAAKWTVYTYDGLGRTLTVTAADGSVTTYAYAGASVTVVDAAGKWKRSYTDALGNLVRVEEPNPAGGANYQTTYTYTTLNQLWTVTMPRPVGSNTVTQTRTFTYTGAQVASATNPENGTVQYLYNAAQQVTQRVDAKGQMTTYEYDTAARLVTVRHYPVQWQEDQAQRVSYTYDTQSLVPGYTENGTGRVAAVEFVAGGASGKAMRYVYKYNAAGRVTGRKMQVDRGSGYWYDIDVGYTWDNEGRVTALAHPDGSNYSYTFDAMGRLNGMSGAGTASATYGVAGQLTGLSYLGVTETRVYNDVLQMTRLTAVSGGSNVVDMEYVYAAGRNNGRITQAWDHVNGEQVNYTYDSLNRLATAVTADNTNVAQWGLQFSYDGFGNANGQTVIKGSAPAGTWGVEAATNRVIGETYDANGNPVGARPIGVGGGPQRVFDVENRMVADVANGIAYGYDDQGKRVWRATSTAAEVYVWGVDGKRLATYQQGAFNQDCQCVFYGWVASNVYFGGKLVKTAGTVVVTDRLGSVRWKGNGETYHYHPYGQQYAGDSTASKVDGKEKFGTYFRDADGKDYADQRYFSQGAGRFWTPDPYQASGGPADPGSWNRYAYTRGDPVNLRDRRGLEDEDSEDGDPEDSGDDPEPPPQGSPGGTRGSSPAEVWSNLSVPTRLRLAKETLALLIPARLTEDCMNLLGQLSKTEGADDINGKPAPPITKDLLVKTLNEMTFYNLDDEWIPTLVSDLYQFTEPELYASAQTKYGNLTVREDLKKGFAAQLFSNRVYYTNIDGGSALMYVSSIFEEALHNIGYSEARVNALGKSKLDDTCIGPLKVQ